MPAKFALKKPTTLRLPTKVTSRVYGAPGNPGALKKGGSAASATTDYQKMYVLAVYLGGMAIIIAALAEMRQEGGKAEGYELLGAAAVASVFIMIKTKDHFAKHWM